MTYANEYVRWVYFDQGTSESGNPALACHPANQAAATLECVEEACVDSTRVAQVVARNVTVFQRDVFRMIELARKRLVANKERDGRSLLSQVCATYMAGLHMSSIYRRTPIVWHEAK